MTEEPAEDTSWREQVCAIGAVVLVAAGSVSACRRSNQSSAGSEPVTLRMGLSVGQTAAASNSLAGIRQLNLSVEGLVNVGEDGRLVPLLAKSWDYSPEGRALRVHLRPGVTFHDGSPVTAAAVVKVLQTALPDVMGPVFQDIERIAAASDS